MSLTASALSRRTFGLSSVAAFAAPALAAAEGSAWTEHSIRSPDGPLAYAVGGQGPLLVMLPGGPGGSGWALRHWVAPLTSQCTVLLLDNLGRGRSARLADRSRYTLARDADDVERLRQHLGLARLAVYGHSYGGLVAQAWAARQPGRVQALLLGNTLHGARSWQQQIDACNRHVERQHPEVWRQLLALRAKGLLSSDADYQALYGPVVEPLYWRDPALAARSRPPKSPQPAHDAFNGEVYTALLGADPEWTVGGTLAGVELLPGLARVQAPALVLSGRFDVIGAPLTAQELAVALPRSRLRVFEASAHRPFVEEPAAWAATVAGFLREAAA